MSQKYKKVSDASEHLPKFNPEQKISIKKRPEKSNRDYY